MSKKETRRKAIDPQTRDLLDQLTQRDERRSMSARERRARDKTKARLRRRVNWDLPTTIKDRIKAIAREERIPESQIAAWLLAHALDDLGEDRAARREKLDPFKEVSESPRYEWNLRLEPVDPHRK
jgi:hypothetical protein